MWIICENPLFLLPAYAKATADESAKACFSLKYEVFQCALRTEASAKVR